jgi:hypothetical protein
MPNINPLDIEEAIAAILSAVDDVGEVLTDRRFSQGNSEFVRLLLSQSPDDQAKGWIVTWNGIAQSIRDDCSVVIDCAFTLIYYFPFGRRDSTTSEAQFKDILFNCIEALNADPFLNLGDTVRHEGLQSTAPFDITTSGTAGQIPMEHVAEFELIVRAENTY